jgi:hypothetical protein
MPDGSSGVSVPEKKDDCRAPPWQSSKVPAAGLPEMGDAAAGNHRGGPWAVPKGDGGERKDGDWLRGTAAAASSAAAGADSRSPPEGDPAEGRAGDGGALPPQGASGLGRHLRNDPPGLGLPTPGVAAAGKAVPWPIGVAAAIASAFTRVLEKWQFLDLVAPAAAVPTGGAFIGHRPSDRGGNGLESGAWGHGAQLAEGGTVVDAPPAVSGLGG